MAPISVNAANLSDAWLQAIAAVYREPGHTAMHSMVRIEDPISEAISLREDVDQLMKEALLPPVTTVANTIFPSVLARKSAGHAELAEGYRSLYPTLRRFPPNSRGTYFGRLVAYPSVAGGTVDQLAQIIRRLGEESARKNPKTASYEAIVTSVDESDEVGLPGVSVCSAPIYVGGVDNSVMGFPCLSHCSFQLDRNDTVHLLASYRSQYMVRRAYGNYVGLGQLLQWVAGQAGLSIGTVTVAAGYAKVDQSLLKVASIIGRHRA